MSNCKVCALSGSETILDIAVDLGGFFLAWRRLSKEKLRAVTTHRTSQTMYLG